MRQFKTVFKFELKNHVANKIYIGLLIGFVVIIGILLSFPRISQALKGADTPGHKSVMLIKDENVSEALLIQTAFVEAFGDYDVQIAFTGEQEVKDSVSSGNAKCAFIFSDLMNYTYCVGNISLQDVNKLIADEVLTDVYRAQAFAENGVELDKVQEIMTKVPSGETLSFGKDQMQNFFYTYIMVFALYMVLVLYGQMVATSVASEKSSRAMELLITSAPTSSMIFGKVAAACFAGFLQLFALFGSAVLFFNVNREFWADNTMVSSIFNMPSYLLLYMLLFFVLGFVVYALLYAAIGSTVSKVEEVSTAIMPLTMLIALSIMLFVYAIMNNSVDGVLMKVCSFIPLISPVAMFTRISMSTVPAYEIIVSVLLLVLCAFGVGVLASRIYKVGVLLYGTKPKFFSLAKSVLAGGAKK